MTNFKRCATAMALVLGSSVPALSQETPDRVILAIEGTEIGYRVPIEVAAELCGEIPAETLAAIATDADLIYCTVAETVVAESGFDDDPYIERIEGLGDNDGPDDLTAGEDGADDGEGADADAEADVDGEVDADDGADDDASADGGTDGGAEAEDGTDDGAAEDEGTEDGADAGAEAEVDTDVEADADAEAGADSGDDAGSDN